MTVNVIQENIEYLQAIKADDLSDAIEEKLSERANLKAQIEDLKREIDNRTLPLDYRPEQYSEEENHELLELAHRIMALEHSNKDLIWIENILNAQYYFAVELNRDQIIKKLASLHQQRRTDIISCWGWIKKHHTLIKSGVANLYKPYQCELGSHSKKQDLRRKVDREFSTLRAFLPSYNLQKNSEYLFLEHEKYSRPDFIVSDLEGKQLGIEVTDAYINDVAADDEGERKDSFDFLHCECGLEDFFISFPAGLYPHLYWQNKTDEIKETFKDEIVPYARSKGGEPKRWDLFGVIVDVRPGEKLIELSTEKLNLPYFGDYFERSYADVINKRIDIKINRSEPEFKPSILVIRPILDYITNDHVTIKKHICKSASVDKMANHFKEIWYIHNFNAIQIILENLKDEN